jgi:YHS domain-containing protein
MNGRIIGIGTLLILGLSVIAVITLCPNDSGAQDTESGTTQAATAPVLTRVEPRYVCMLTDTVTDRYQLPVTIDGKHYYGCCHMCEAKLKEDPGSRLATDPVSGKQVDKSGAVIGVAPDGKVYYFESVEDLNAFGKNTGQ